VQRKADPEKYCAHCSAMMQRKEFNGRLEDYRVFLRRKYCSLRCANSRKHPKNWTTYHWRAQKHKKKACESCGYTKSLHAHHIDQNVQNNAAENIQTLCKHCHDFWHTAQKRMGLPVAGRMPRIFAILGSSDSISLNGENA
jgi:5-methylcytosine-specific restriction endonuclease McrA